MKRMKQSLTAALALLLLLLLMPAAWAEKAEFTYKLTLTDRNGREVTNLRALSNGETVNVEIELTRADASVASYETYGMEFRLETQGLDYNFDGASFRQGTAVTRQIFDSGDSVGFAFYDMEQKGERVNNPVLAGRWSYTVSDPGAANITVPVALLYVTGGSDSIEPVGNARLFLDPNGGSIVGTDVSGEYPSGTIVRLPDAAFADYAFKGWGLGLRSYRAGDNYTVTGITTLVAQWEGLVRNRQVIFDANGGMIPGTDPSGMYADGEIIVIPSAEREGYALSGWSMGGNTWAPDDRYTVDNSVVFIAQWGEPLPAPEPAPVKGLIPSWVWCLLGLVVLGGLGWWLILIMWKRFVRYSLIDGGVKLSYRDRKHISAVQVYLTAEDENGEKMEHLLDTSGMVDSGEKLKLINGTYVVFGLKKGFYKGRLHVTYTDGKKPKDIKVIIRTLKKEFNEEEKER